ncbi:uncharacterized protein LOC114736784 [Neltuma alba]|uniref:uncharacterized protein LOC114736784 n=1 Tax=Neltuma alba TaxID=207710 RepID=UPI0010A4A610|nr:uncharacterized protein LOC114736784 [Prosopis alba]
MEDYITIRPEKLLTNPTDLASRSSGPSHIAILMDEIMSAAMEADGSKSSAAAGNDKDKVQKPQEGGGGGGPRAECRFCHDEDCVSRFDTPCRCSGTLKYAHRSCIQKWCNIKGDTICEICRQPYGPGYAVTHRSSSNNDEDDEREGWRIPSTNAQIYSPLTLAEMATDRMAAALNEDCDFRHPTGGVLCGTGVLIIFIVMILRDVYYYRPPQQQDKMFNYFMFVSVDDRQFHYCGDTSEKGTDHSDLCSREGSDSATKSGSGDELQIRNHP